MAIAWRCDDQELNWLTVYSLSVIPLIYDRLIPLQVRRPCHDRAMLEDAWWVHAIRLAECELVCPGTLQ